MKLQARLVMRILSIVWRLRFVGFVGNLFIFKGTTNTPRLQQMKQIASLGGAFSTNANRCRMCHRLTLVRESLLYQCSVFLNDVDKAVATLADATLHPSYSDDAIAEEVSGNVRGE